MYQFAMQRTPKYFIVFWYLVACDRCIFLNLHIAIIKLPKDLLSTEASTVLQMMKTIQKINACQSQCVVMQESQESIVKSCVRKSNFILKFFCLKLKAKISCVRAHKKIIMKTHWEMNSQKTEVLNRALVNLILTNS